MIDQRGYHESHVDFFLLQQIAVVLVGAGLAAGILQTCLQVRRVNVADIGDNYVREFDHSPDKEAAARPGADYSHIDPVVGRLRLEDRR